MSFSVLLSVHFAENSVYLRQALTSIWDEQTLKPDQIVLVKDGPLTPELEAEIARWLARLQDVMTVVALPRNVGLGAALNEGLEACEHELVARMDTDDVAFGERFARQVAFMNMNPEVVACSAALEEWDEKLETRLGCRRLPCEPDKLFRFAKCRSPLSHPLVFLRKSVVQAVGGYPPLRKAQDHALWSLLLSKGYALANLPEVLLKMRTGNELLERRGWDYFREEYKLIRYQRSIGFLSAMQYYANIFLRACLRLSPNSIKRLAYRLAR